MDISKNFLNVKNLMICGVFVFLVAVNLYSFTEGYTEKVHLYSPKASNQTMYMPEFLDDGMYPDAFIRALVRDKKVSVYAEFNPYVNYPSHGHDHTEDVGSGEVFFSHEYYIDNNYGLFFKKYAKSFEADNSLPSPEEVLTLIGEPERKKYFSFLGYANDMLRNTFLVNEDREYVNSYFHYAFYYYYAGEDTVGSSFMAYVSPEDLSEADEIVAIWDKRENLYLMSRQYYDHNIRDWYDTGN